MEPQQLLQGKPRLVYGQVFAAPQDPKNIFGTVAWVIERFIVEMNGLDGRPPVKTLGQSHLFLLRLLQRWPIGAKQARELHRHDVIEHCQKRREKVMAATVNQDVTYLSGVLKYAGSAWDDCTRISDRAVVKAKPFLVKHNLIGKSTPRTRRPTPQEVVALLAHFAIENARKQNEIDMVKVARWQLASLRRISETCRMTWLDWDPEGHTMLVHKMKDPKNRNKTKRVAMTEAATELLYEWAWAMNANPASWHDPEPRILPYKSTSCSARYTLAKIALEPTCPGIRSLRMHDSRRDKFTRLVEDDGYSLEETILFSGHETIAIPQRNYLAQRPELCRYGPRSKRIAAEHDRANQQGAHVNA